MLNNELNIYKMWCKHSRSHNADNENPRDERAAENGANASITREMILGNIFIVEPTVDQMQICMNIENTVEDPGMVAHPWNPNTQETEEGRAHELKVSLGYPELQDRLQ